MLTFIFISPLHLVSTDINNFDDNPIDLILGNAANKYTVRETDGEATLDVDCLTGIAPGANTSFFLMSYYDGKLF